MVEGHQQRQLDRGSAQRALGLLPAPLRDACPAEYVAAWRRGGVTAWRKAERTLHSPLPWSGAAVALISAGG